VNQTKAGGALYRNGWVVGAVVAILLIAAFFLYVRQSMSAINETLMLGVPIGVLVGALVGLAVGTRSMPRRRRIRIGLSILAVFVLYIIALTLYLMASA